jgi:hypothetical protein
MMREDQNTPEEESTPNEALGSRATSSLGLKLRAIRKKFIAGGGQLLTREELLEEIAERRGGVSRRSHEEENLR